MKEPRYRTFEEFWPFYVGQHAKKSTRTLHFVGTSAAMACALGGLLLHKRWLLLVAPLAGYGPAWISHFFIEKNRPATFTYPLWSLRADFVMWSKILAGTMDAEVDRAASSSMASEPVAEETRPSAAPQASEGTGFAGRDSVN